LRADYKLISCFSSLLFLSLLQLVINLMWHNKIQAMCLGAITIELKEVIIVEPKEVVALGAMENSDDVCIDATTVHTKASAWCSDLPSSLAASRWSNESPMATISAFTASAS
jgi:hypothetical protein